jgi:hypothetical protein
MDECWKAEDLLATKQVKYDRIIVFYMTLYTAACKVQSASPAAPSGHPNTVFTFP